MFEKNDSELYALRLLDYSAPSFCTGHVWYYGTKEMILDFLGHREKFHWLLEAAQAYFDGTGDSALSLFGEAATPILCKVEFIASRDYVIENLTFQFENFWECVRDISVRRLEAELLYIRDDDRIWRLVRATAEHMVDRDDFRYWEHRFWGLPGFIVKTGEDGLKNTLFFADRDFSGEEEVRMDLKEPKSIDMTQFMLEICGDG